ncbi:MAG: hypothetical protein OHK0017_00020 [Patescibacteria group bacterium]
MFEFGVNLLTINLTRFDFLLDVSESEPKIIDFITNGDQSGFFKCHVSTTGKSFLWTLCYSFDSHLHDRFQYQFGTGKKRVWNRKHKDWTSAGTQNIDFLTFMLKILEDCADLSNLD